MLNVDVFLRDLTMISGVKSSRMRTSPLSPCLSCDSESERSTAVNGSTFERSIRAEPRLFACSIWFQSKTSSWKSAAAREGCSD